MSKYEQAKEEFNRLVRTARLEGLDKVGKIRLGELANRTHHGIKHHPWVGEVTESIAVDGGGMLVGFSHGRWAAAKTDGD